MRTALPAPRAVFPILVLLAGGCAAARSVSDSALAQTVGAAWGPCGGARDSVRAALGAPDRTEYHEDEDLSERTRAFAQEWGYRMPPDSARVIRFGWHDGSNRCEVGERRLRWRDWEREV